MAKLFQFFQCLSQYDRWFYANTLLFVAAIILLFITVLSRKNTHIITVVFISTFFIIFRYTFLVVPARAQSRIQIVRFEKIDIIPIATHEYRFDLFKNHPAFIQSNINTHSVLKNQNIKLDYEYLGEYRGLITVKTDEKITF